MKHKWVPLAMIDYWIRFQCSVCFRLVTASDERAAKMTMNDDDQDGCPGKRSVAPSACGNPWLDPKIAEQQRELVDRQLAERPWPMHFTVYADAVRAVIDSTAAGCWHVVEVGCGTGHGVEILSRSNSSGDSFAGIDISPRAIDLARKRNPLAVWIVDDAPVSGDIIIDGSCVLHVDDWRAHLAALCAASRDAVILHRLPVSPRAATFKAETRGYGHVFPAWSFSFPEVVGVMASHGFEHTETRKADGDSLTLTFRKRNR